MRHALDRASCGHFAARASGRPRLLPCCAQNSAAPLARAMPSRSPAWRSWDVVLAFWLPTFPASIYRFFQRVFDLPGWAEIVVANDLAGLFFFAYWIAVFDVLTIYIVPWRSGISTSFSRSR